MAGIGFSLKKLFKKKGIAAMAQAYGYAGLICVGPMILGCFMLLGVGAMSRLGGINAHSRELLNSMLTYSFLASLTVSSCLNMVVTRYIADMFYEECTERIMPSFYGSTAVMLVIGSIGYGVFLAFSGVMLLYKILCFCLFGILTVVWTEMNYLTALKDYKSLVTAFAVSLGIGFLLAFLFLWLKKISVITLFLSVIAGYGILMVWYYKLLIDYFPKSEGSQFSYLRYLDKYRTLALNGFFVNVGLFGHLIIMYFGPLQVRIEGLFYGAPLHDIPALFSFISILITTINFVTSVEVNFYPRYRNYYSLFNDAGSIVDIEQSEEEMLVVLEYELTFTALKQLITTILFVVFGTVIMRLLPLGFNDLAIGIFRLLCVGYGLYAVGNIIMLILLYYSDNEGAVVCSAIFAVVSIGVTIWQIYRSSVNFFGLGFCLGALGFALSAWIRLRWYTKRLPYFLLSRQKIVPDETHGIFHRLCNWLERREKIDEK